jgi:endonuclease III
VTAVDIHPVVRILKKTVAKLPVPVVGVFAESRDPFIVLISCLLSLRTRDAVTSAASERLFALADAPKKLAALPVPAIQKAIYPVCFYRVKARTLKALAIDLLERFGGRVPDTMEDLLSLKGVGRKTANLTLTLGHRKPGICVDVHVHRISNRMGYLRTKTPDESELALRRKLPKEYWMIYNDLLVPYGQHLCTPISPWCSKCPVSSYCARRGVETSR